MRSVTTLTSIAIAAAACGGHSERPPVARPPASATLDVGAGGGDYTAFGLKLSIPAGALPERTTITVEVGAGAPPCLPSGFLALSNSFRVTADPAVPPAKPILITLPLTEVPMMGAPSVLGMISPTPMSGAVNAGDLNSTLVTGASADAVNVLAFDLSSRNVTFVTGYFGSYAAVVGPGDEEEPGPVLTEFRPSSNGFAVHNFPMLHDFVDADFGPCDTRGGQCLGMSAMAQYVFNYARGATELLRRNDTAASDGWPTQMDWVARRIAARAQCATDVGLVSAPSFVSAWAADPDVLGRRVIDELARGRPVVMYRGAWSSEFLEAHAVLAYAFTGTDFLIYDPNCADNDAVTLSWVRPPGSSRYIFGDYAGCPLPSGTGLTLWNGYFDTSSMLRALRSNTILSDPTAFSECSSSTRSIFDRLEIVDSPSTNPDALFTRVQLKPGEWAGRDNNFVVWLETRDAANPSAPFAMARPSSDGSITLITPPSGQNRLAIIADEKRAALGGSTTIWVDSRSGLVGCDAGYNPYNMYEFCQISQGTAHLRVGDTIEIFSATPSGNRVDIPGESWKADDPSIVSVNGSVVKGESVGSTHIASQYSMNGQVSVGCAFPPSGRLTYRVGSTAVIQAPCGSSPAPAGGRNSIVDLSIEADAILSASNLDPFFPTLEYLCSGTIDRAHCAASATCERPTGDAPPGIPQRLSLAVRDSWGEWVLNGDFTFEYGLDSEYPCAQLRIGTQP